MNGCYDGVTSSAVLCLERQLYLSPEAYLAVEYHFKAQLDFIRDDYTITIHEYINVFQLHCYSLSRHTRLFTLIRLKSANKTNSQSHFRVMMKSKDPKSLCVSRKPRKMCEMCMLMVSR